MRPYESLWAMSEAPSRRMVAVALDVAWDHWNWRLPAVPATTMVPRMWRPRADAAARAVNNVVAPASAWMPARVDPSSTLMTE